MLAGLRVARWEPALALDGGLDGLDLIRRFLALAPSRIAPAGLILLEIESGQGHLAESIARSHFSNAEIEIITDLAGKDRLIKIQT